MSPHTGTLSPPSVTTCGQSKQKIIVISIHKTEILWDIKEPPLSNDGCTVDVFENCCPNLLNKSQPNPRYLFISHWCYFVQKSSSVTLSARLFSWCLQLYAEVLIVLKIKSRNTSQIQAENTVFSFSTSKILKTTVKDSPQWVLPIKIKLDSLDVNIYADFLLHWST